MSQRRNLASIRPTREQPEVFGRYRLRGVLGQWSMGNLYIAEQTGVEGFVKLVALKRILPHLADSDHFREMFVNEARVAACLDHPNIISTYELGEVNGAYFLTMEYLPGEDLARILGCCGPEPIPIDVAVALVQQGANGLHYAHEKRDSPGSLSGQVHGGVNPLSIVVTYFGTIKLLNFGAVNGAGGATVPGTFKREYAYSSPEQLDGRQVDRRSDVFSLGVVLWECLTGRRLFAGTAAGAMRVGLSRRIEPASSVRSDVPPELDQIVHKAVAHDPQRRYQTARELSEALQQFLLRHGYRPTPNRIGDWLESVFGVERATLKKSIAQGGEVENALARLRALSSGDEHSYGAIPESLTTNSGKSRALWSTSFNHAGTEGSDGSPASGIVTDAARLTPPPSAAVFTDSDELPDVFVEAPEARIERPRSAGRALQIAGIVAAVAAAVPIAIYLAASDATAPMGLAEPSLSQRRAVQGAVDVRSEPSGALIIVDGTPSGQTTPAVLSGLPVTGRPLEIRVSKPGYQPTTRQIQVLLQAEPQLLAFDLVKSTGTVHLRGVPKRSSVFLDEEPADAETLRAVSVGTHKLRVETPGDVLFFGDIEVRPGVQNISVGQQGQQETERTTP